MNLHAAQLRILAFEPFDSGSHRAVRESIDRHSRHGWTWVTRPGRAWKWRMRLGAFELIDAASGLDSDQFDVVFITSLASAADLRAGLPPALRTKPLMLYMHENQAAYPFRDEAGDRAWDANYACINLASVLTADRTIWNSRFNLESFITGIVEILGHAPDGAIADVESRIRSRSAVIWPPVEPPPPEAPPESPPKASPETTRRTQTDAPIVSRIRADRSIRVAWPHRWEHDKGPERLLELAEKYTTPLGLRWTILGESFRKTPPALLEFKERFRDSIDHFGYAPNRDDYWRRLAACDWVLSTARHEFFGIAVVEAMLAGCLPWLPNELSYPELLPACAKNLSPVSPPPDEAAVRAAVRDHLAPALAANAVCKLDEAVSELVRRA